MKSETTFHEDFLEKITNVQWNPGKSTVFSRDGATYQVELTQADSKQFTISLWFKIDNLGGLGAWNGWYTTDDPPIQIPLLDQNQFAKDFIPSQGTPGFTILLEMWSNHIQVDVLCQSRVGVLSISDCVTDFYAPEGDPEGRLQDDLDAFLANFGGSSARVEVDSFTALGYDHDIRDEWHHLTIAYDRNFQGEASSDPEKIPWGFQEGVRIMGWIDGARLERRPFLPIFDDSPQFDDKDILEVFNESSATQPFVYRNQYEITETPEESDPITTTYHYGYSLVIPVTGFKVTGNNIMIPDEGNHGRFDDETVTYADVSIWLGKFIEDDSSLYASGYVPYKEAWARHGKPQYFYTGAPTKFIKNLGTAGGNSVKNQPQDVNKSKEFPD